MANFAGSLLSRQPKQTSFQPERSSSSPIQENVLSPVAPTHHVVNGPGILDTNLARHDSTLAKRRTTAEAKAMADPFF